MDRIERRFTSGSFGSHSKRSKDGEEREDVPAVAIEERAKGDGLPDITGYTAVFGVDTEIPTMFGSFREQIKKGAFRRAIREGQDVRALRNHEPDNLLGRSTSKTLRMKEDDTGLNVRITPPDTNLGRDTVEMIRRGDLSGMSFAFIPRKVKWINGEDGAPDLRIIEDVDLYDVGPVTYPAYAQTTAEVEQASAIHAEGLRQLGVDPEQRKHDLASLKKLRDPDGTGGQRTADEELASKEEEKPEDHTETVVQIDAAALDPEAWAKFFDTLGAKVDGAIRSISDRTERKAKLRLELELVQTKRKRQELLIVT